MLNTITRKTYAECCANTLPHPLCPGCGADFVEASWCGLNDRDCFLFKCGSVLYPGDMTRTPECTNAEMRIAVEETKRVRRLLVAL
jgi:hypothetical protein